MELYALRDISASDPDLQEVDIYYLEQILQKGKGCTRLLKATSADSDSCLAIKLFPKSSSGHVSQGFLTEERSVTKLSHSNLVKYNTFYKDAMIKGKNNEYNKYSAIVMEYVPRGDLFKLINEDSLSEKVARTLFKQMLSVIEYLHTQKVTHLDLKLENFLVTEEGIKLIDFDGCQNLNAACTVALPCGTSGYRPPEFINGGQQDLKAADIYSLGIVLFMMVTGTPPYTEVEGCNNTQKFDQYYQALRKDVTKFWRVHEHYRVNDKKDALSKEFKCLIESMLAERPQDRMKCESIKRCKWFEGPTCTKEELRQALGF